VSSFSQHTTARLTFAQPQVEFDLSYTDTAFISLSTTVVFDYPFPGFAKLPLSLIISLELFSCKVGGPSPSLVLLP
jgi:maintenance of morphology protein 1